MKFKVFLFSESQNDDYRKLKRILAENFCEIEAFTYSKLTQNLVALALKSEGNLILLCPNAQIDDIITQNINSLSNEKQIIDDQVVVFSKDGNKIIFAPCDDAYESFSKVKLGEVKNKSCSFKLFGLPESKVKEKLEAIKNEMPDLQYVIIGRGLNTEIYINYCGTDDLIDNNQVKIATAFKDYIYSDNSLGLEQSIVQLLRLKNLKLAVFEGLTGGALMAKLFASGEHAEKILKSGEIKLLTDELTPDNVYKQTLQLLENSETFAVNIQGEYNAGLLTCVYAIGNKLSIDVYNCSIRAEREKAISFALDAIMFNIIKKLRQNSLGF